MMFTCSLQECDQYHDDETKHASEQQVNQRAWTTHDKRRYIDSVLARQSRRRREIAATHHRETTGATSATLASNLIQDTLEAGREADEVRRLRARKSGVQSDFIRRPELKRIRKQLRKKKKRNLRGEERKRLAKVLAPVIAARLRQVAAKRVLALAINTLRLLKMLIFCIHSN